MKRLILYILPAILLMSACSEDYNKNNFPGYEDAANPTNVVKYTYTLINTDYSAIATTLKKPVNDSITLLNTQLKTTKTHDDSVKIQAIIARLKTKLTTDSTCVAATAIETNKMFINSTQAAKLISNFLLTKYLYCDANSSAIINYNQSYDTTKIATADKYTLVTTDYDAMGTTTSRPGQFDNFSTSIDPNYYLPIFLKKTYPFAVSGDLKLIRYKYFANSATTQVGTVYIYDGSNWNNYNTTSQSSKTFEYRNGVWLDRLILKESFTKDFGVFTSVKAVGTYNWAWGTYNGASYIKANAYGATPSEIWLISPAIDLKDRLNPVFTYDQSIAYATGQTLSDLINVYISTDYNGNNLSTANWKRLEVTYPPIPASSWSAFVNAGNISLKAYVNQKVYIAFKYVATTTAIGWEISNVNITEN